MPLRSRRRRRGCGAAVLRCSVLSVAATAVPECSVFGTAGWLQPEEAAPAGRKGSLSAAHSRPQSAEDWFALQDSMRVLSQSAPRTRDLTASPPTVGPVFGVINCEIVIQ